MSRRGTNVYRRKDGRNDMMNRNVPSSGIAREPLFCDFAASWFELKEKDLELSSRERYRQLLDCHILPVLGTLHCDEITTEVVHNFILEKQCNGRLNTPKGLSARTVHIIFGIINEIICYARDYLNYTIIVTDIPLPKLSIRPRNVFDTASIHIIVSAARENHTANLRCLGILICMYTGLRIGKLCALKWSDIHMDTGDIYITRTIQKIAYPDSSEQQKKTYLYGVIPKTQKSKREVPICSILKEHSNLYSPTAYVLSGSTTKSSPT